MHPEPILRARPCPDPMKPPGASRLERKALAAGWDVRVGIALGYRRVGRHDSGVYRPIRSVMVEGRRNGVRFTAMWVGEFDGSGMKFDGGRWTEPREYGFAAGVREIEAKVDAL